MAEIIRKFGRIESPPDSRDFDLKNFIPKAIGEIPEEMNWNFPSHPLEQGSTPHCVGFSMASFGINLPTFTPYTNRDGHEFYYRCKVVDGDPTGENGSTLRSAAKVLQYEGVVENYAFAHSKDTIKWWLLNRGPLIIGIMWTDTMMVPDENFVLDISGDFIGGHALIANEIRKDDYVGLQNSWGKRWGKNGKAYIHIDDLMDLFRYGGEAIAAVELENHRKKKEPFLKAIWSGIINFVKRLIKWFQA